MIEIVRDEITPALRIRDERLTDFTSVNAQILQDGLARSETNFTSHSFQGDPWEALAASTLKKKARMGIADTPLVETGQLMEALFAPTTTIEPMMAQASVDRPTRRGYNVASIQQNGSDSIPARPFLGWSEERIPVYEQMISDWIAGA